MRVRPRATTVEAVRFVGFSGGRPIFDNYTGARPIWLADALLDGALSVGDNGRLCVFGDGTPLDMKDWIVRDERGDLKAMKLEQFAAQYEEAA
jgi:hypothetical protein